MQAPVAGYKYLIIAPSWLGDIIMSQTLLGTLKRLNPLCHISVYAPAYAHPILRRMPQVDELLVNPFAHGALRLKQRFEEARRLALGAFDCAIVLPNSLKSALIPYLAGIKDRRGFRGELRYGLLNDLRTNKQIFPRLVERYVSLAYPKAQFHQKEELPEFDYPALLCQPPAEELLLRLDIKVKIPLLAIGCGANYGPAKLWPARHFAKVCTYWLEQGGGVLAVGTAKDQEAVAAVKELIPASLQERFYAIAGQTKVDEALDLIGICRGAVCNDSGLMHTVAAAGRPQVCIFGSTSTAYTPPLSDQAVCLESTLECHPCFQKRCALGTYACLSGISPEQVLQTVKQWI